MRRRAGDAAWPGRIDLAGVRVYCSEHAHSSVDKAVILLGLGHEAVTPDSGRRRVPHARRPARRRDRRGSRRGPSRRSPSSPRSAHVDHERRSGAGTSRTSAAASGSGCTSTPRTPASRRWCRATSGSCDGAEAADSIVVNPHKWLFTPFDLSVLYCRRMDVAAPGVFPDARVPARPPKGTPASVT